MSLDYPCSYPAKVFLRPDAATETALIKRVQTQLEPGTPLEVERRPSAAGTYLCLTLRFTAQSAEHAQRVAATIRAADGILMAL